MLFTLACGLFIGLMVAHFVSTLLAHFTLLRIGLSVGAGTFGTIHVMVGANDDTSG